MTDQPKKPATGKKRQQASSGTSKNDAVKASDEAAESVAEPKVDEAQYATTTDEAPVETAKAAPRRPAEEWLATCAFTFDVKPWILREAVAGHPSGRTYTEDEIRRLIQRKLEEPA